MNVKTKQQTDLYLLYQFFKESGDKRRVGQIKSVIEKYKEERFTICFSGHFSAGKSSLINELMSDHFLPTSPVPTSANVVKISYGSPQIDIHFFDGRHLVFTPPFDEKAIWEACKNGQDVRVVQIRTEQGLPPHLEWMDTPGIDSTDPLHMANTEDAVIISDHIFYVVDYNHVLASENYQFLLSIQEMGKPFHLVVSQIDKHREAEISFQTYKKSIIDSLSTWQLHPESLHFISIKDKSLAINEWDNFKKYLMALSQSGSSEMDEAAVIQKLTSDHKAWWEQEHLDEENDLKELLPSGLNKEDVLTKLAETEDAIQKLEVEESEWAEAALSSGEKAVQSALLMPYETRELARKYIESCQSHFKVGFFSSKGKVEQERKKRLDQLSENLNQLLQTMKRQTTESLVNALGQHATLTEEMKEHIFSLNVAASEDQIDSYVEKGALPTGQYILNFTKAIENTFKNQMKRQVIDILETIKPVINQPFENKIQNLKEELRKCQEMLSHFESFTHFEDNQNEHMVALDEILNGERALTAGEQTKLAHEIEDDDVGVLGGSLSSEIKQTKNTVTDQPTNDEAPLEVKETVDTAENDDLDWSKLFHQAEQILKHANGFEQFTQRFKRRAERLENKRYTIALFGAFSAGKSSFANALMGHSILPVSPHPTTATINRIFPVDDSHPNKTVVITLKNEAAILGEVNRALETFHIQIDRLDTLKDALIKAGTYDTESHHKVFLGAVINGYAAIKDKLGSSITIPLDEALSYISEEQKACFVDTADIYYDCELTRQGIVLVDTPGADSINARHTNTAFKFIRNADAIVYVTYYNHAFSRADQEFLIQLGRVKDTFEMDKMFFVINAIDLANSSSEVDDVKNYVRNRLLSFGIRHARLYGVSSLSELTHENESGFSEFYKDWKAFVQFGLQKQSIDQGIRDLVNANHLLNDLIEKTSLSEQDKEVAREKVTNDYNRIQALLKKPLAVTFESRINGEVDELFFYVKKRVMQRYIDEFAYFFNPSTLSSGQSESNKTLLRKCLDECIQFLSFDIDQEVRATYLRTESMLRKLIKEVRAERENSVGQDWAMDLPDEFDSESPEIALSLKAVGSNPFEASFKHFKNPKQFFEGGGARLLRDALLDVLSIAIDRVLADNSDVTRKHYTTAFNKTIEEDNTHASSALDTIYKQKMRALSSSNELSDQLKDAKNKLNGLGVFH